MKIRLYAITMIALLTSITAAGQPEQSLYHPIGPYVEGGLGTNLYVLGVVTSEDTDGTAGITGFAWNVAAGYNLRSWFGLEAGFTRGSIKVNDKEDNYYTDSSGKFIHEIKNDTYNQYINAPYASMRFTVPICERFSFIGKLGLMYANASDDRRTDSNLDDFGIVLPYIGIGAAYAIAPKLDFTVQYQGALYAVVNAAP